MTVDLLWCDGTWSKPGARSAVSQALRTELAGSRVRFSYVDYPAEFSEATGRGDMSLGQSVAVGMDAMTRAVRDAPGRVFIGGYSQGGMVAVRFARERLPYDWTIEADAVVTLGDPHQPSHLGRSGIAGPLEVPRPRISVYAPGDPIADLRDGSPLRSIFDLGEWMALRTIEDAHLWAKDLIEKAIDVKVQAWWNPLRWRDVNDALAAANRYFGTAHTLSYIEGGHIQRLAGMVEKAVDGQYN